MRVLIAHSGNLFGGIETALISLVRAARRQSALQIDVALSYAHSRAARELRAAGGTVHDLGPARLSRPWTVWRARRQLGRVLQLVTPDVCLMPSAWAHTLFVPAVRRAGLPVALWANDVWSKSRKLDAIAARHRPDLIVANSRFTADAMRQVFAEVPVRVVYYPLETPPPPPDIRERLRAQVGASAQTAVIVQVARMEPYKGHALLIDALRHLPAASDWQCWFVGGAERPHEGRYLQSLEQAAGRAGLTGRVRFLGSRDDVAQCLRAADIFCHPNIGPEPFGLVFLEAMRAGLPVVGTALGGVTEIVTSDCGRLVPPGDAPALGAALQALIEAPDLRSTLGSHGPARAAELCDPDRRLADLAAALEELPVAASGR